MVAYKCFNCSKKVADTYVVKRVRCPYCGGKMLFKPRKTITKIKSR